MKPSIALLVALALGCGSADGADYADDSSDGEQTQDVVAEPAAADASQKPVIPLCDGEDEPAPDECQTLVYTSHGYCNRWHACD